MSSIMDSVRSIIVSARTKKDSTGPSSGRRGLFGTVTPRYDAAGNLIAWQVRYPDPKRPGKKVQRQFKPDMEHEAHQWLEGERHLVELDRKNIQEWVHPSERRRRKRTSLISFEDYVIRWAEEYRLPNGERIAGGTRRNLYLDIAHFMPGFKGKLLTVRHSVNRGYSDRGSTRIARTKTDSSRRTVCLSPTNSAASARRSPSSTTSASSPSTATRSSTNSPKTSSKRLSYMKSINKTTVILFKILLIIEIH